MSYMCIRVLLIVAVLVVLILDHTTQNTGLTPILLEKAKQLLELEGLTMP